MNFEDFNLHKNIIKAVTEMGYKNPTPIQEKAIPIILKGDDLVGCAQTGTGKTAAFAIPILDNLLQWEGKRKPTKRIKVLVVTPTRELAIQIGENFDAYATHTNITQTTIFGGVSQVSQVNQLRKGVDILIATPGRLLDLKNQGLLDLTNVRYLVLDEADQMLDMGFIHDIKKIVKLIPKKRQTLLFSATMPTSIRELADTFLNNPQSVSVAPVSSTAETVEQEIYFVDKTNKRKLLTHLVKNENLRNVLAFTRTKHGADNVAKFLKKNGVTAEAIHGGKSQNARQRVLAEFKEHKLTVLVATDIAARGIDIDQLPFVVNFDLPNVPESYVHRIGRTGRAGKNGLAISFCSSDEKPYWKDILKLTKTKVKMIDNHPFPMQQEVGTTSKADNAKAQNPPHKPARNPRKSPNGKQSRKRWS